MEKFNIDNIRKINLQRILNDKHLTSADFARMMGKSLSYVSGLLRIRRSNDEKITSLGDAKVLELAKLLNVEPQEFYIFNEESKPKRPGYYLITTNQDDIEAHEELQAILGSGFDSGRGNPIHSIKENLHSFYNLVQGLKSKKRQHKKVNMKRYDKKKTGTK